jgi:hypothetical protein
MPPKNYREPPRNYSGTPGRKGFAPIYSKTMTLYRFYLAEEHVALLDLVATRRKQSRAAVVRAALESYLPAALLADSDSTTTKRGLENRASGNQVDDADPSTV